MNKAISIICGIIAIYFFMAGSFSAYQKTALDSSDMLLLGITFGILSNVIKAIGNVENSESKTTVS